MAFQCFIFKTEQNKRWCFNVLFLRQNKIRGGVPMFCFQTEQNKMWCFNVLFFRQDKIKGGVSRLFSDRTKLEVVFQCFVF